MTEIIEMVKEFIKPELMVLIPVLYAIGYGLKKAETFKDNMIPLVLGMLGVVLSTIYVLSTCDIGGYQSILSGVFVAITQGVLVAAGAVYVNQLIKQTSDTK